MINRIAVLLTCFNRKDKTIACLHKLFEAYKVVENDIIIKVYLTDDASNDNTSEAVKRHFPEVIILEGSGNLFWAGGTRNSWEEAIKEDFDAYLLLNDDTNVNKNLFESLMDCHSYSLSNYNKSGIYIGSTKNESGNLSYGGAVIKSKFLHTYQMLTPSGEIQECDLGNGNIMLITRDVVKVIGILSENYTHGIADYDYTLTARREKLPVLLARNYCGNCVDDSNNKYDKFIKLNFKERIKFLYYPTGLAFSDEVKFMKKFYPYRIPMLYFGAIFKLLFPKLYLTLTTKLR